MTNTQNLSPWIRAAEDLLNHPRHTVTPKGRRWLQAELRALKAAETAMHEASGPLFARRAT